MTRSTTARRKVLVPLATLLAAGAIAVGSGANFTSITANPGASFTTGTLAQQNSRADQAIFDLSNLKPGDTVVDEVTITNSGSLPASFKLTESGVTNEFGDLLELTVVDESGTEVYGGAFGSLDEKPLGTTAWAPKQKHTYTFTLTLDPTTGNDYQGKHAAATYTWDAVQTAGKTFTGQTGTADQS